MWTSQITEQVLSAYSTLEYIDQETRTMDDSSAFRLYVVSIKVSEDGDSVPENAIYQFFGTRLSISMVY
jgi:hypothetical protein